MKKLMYTICLGVCALGISLSSNAQSGKVYGKKFKTEGSFAATELSRRMGEKKNLENVVLEGEISEVCQAEGCWMKLKNAAGPDVFVKFKDHAFVIPKDLAKRHAFVYGTAVRKSVSVEEQRHLAEDAGMSEKEIAKITTPKEELRVDATGVVIE